MNLLKFRIVGLVFVMSWIVSIVQCQSGKDSIWTVKQLVEYHEMLRDSLSPQDVYKFLYQSNFGIEHLLGDSAAVRGYLAFELEQLRQVADEDPLPESLIERISTNDVLVRVNLRLFISLNLSPDTLVEIMFRTAKETYPDTTMFKEQWKAFVDLVTTEKLKYSLDETMKFSSRIESNDFSAVHHSECYRRLHHPAYRIVNRSLFLKYLSSKGIRF